MSRASDTSISSFALSPRAALSSAALAVDCAPTRCCVPPAARSHRDSSRSRAHNQICLDHCGDNGLRELANHRELISEVAVDCLEPVGHRHDSVAGLVGGYVARIDVQDLRRFDSSMIEILVIGIERMVDSEVLSPGYHQVARDGNVAEKIACQPIGCAVDAFAAARSHAGAAVKAGAAAAAAYGAYATATVPIGVLQVIAAC